MSSHAIEKIANMGVQIGQQILQIQAHEQQIEQLTQQVKQANASLGELRGLIDAGRAENAKLVARLSVEPNL